MAKAKHWTPGEIDEIVDYLANISGRSAEGLLRIYDEGGRLVSTVEHQAQRAADALVAIAAGQEPFDQAKFDQAIDNWCDEYLVEGGRDRLLQALRTRRWRAERAKTKRPPRDAASILSWLYSQDPAAAAEACTVFLDGWRRASRPRGRTRQQQQRQQHTGPTIDQLQAELEAQQAALKEARSKMQRTHPDKEGGDVDAFHQARAAFEVAKRRVAEVKAKIAAHRKAA